MTVLSDVQMAKGIRKNKTSTSIRLARSEILMSSHCAVRRLVSLEAMYCGEEPFLGSCGWVARRQYSCTVLTKTVFEYSRLCVLEWYSSMMHRIKGCAKLSSKTICRANDAQFSMHVMFSHDSTHDRRQRQNGSKL